MKRIAVCVGGRPNYIKMAPIVRAIDAAEDLECVLVDAMQHYDHNMRGIFYEEVGLRKPDVLLRVASGAGSQARQTAQAMTCLEYRLQTDTKVDAVLVHGDMNYALGCALAAVKLHIPVIHNEAGLRSFDRRMPEEINRILIDHIATTHFVTEKAAIHNLSRDGIHCPDVVGSTLPESIEHVLGEAVFLERAPDHYFVVTLHRPENVDDPKVLAQKIDELDNLSREFGVEVRLICHPRLRKRLEDANAPTQPSCSGFTFEDPLGYKDMLELMNKAALVITDSGGIQEETTILGVPCLTWRDNTERPVTCEVGTNRLVSGDLEYNVREILTNPPKVQRPKFWDELASSRIVEVLRRMK